MTTVRYTTIKGEVIAEKRNGSRRLYVPDPLGSTVALLDNTQTQVDTFTYWPYGEVRTSTGTTPPPFQFVGTKGYYAGNASKTYVRARYLDVPKGRWLTPDPIGFDGGDMNLYRYALSNVTTMVDPSGMFPCWICKFLGLHYSYGWCWSHCTGGTKPPPAVPPTNPGVIPLCGFIFGGLVEPDCCYAACMGLGGVMDIQCEGYCRNWKAVSKAAKIPCEWLASKCGTLQSPAKEVCAEVFLKCC